MLNLLNKNQFFPPSIHSLRGVGPDYDLCAGGVCGPSLWPHQHLGLHCRLFTDWFSVRDFGEGPRVGHQGKHHRSRAIDKLVRIFDFENCLYFNKNFLKIEPFEDLFRFIIEIDSKLLPSITIFRGNFYVLRS